jgi:hypothetical protein
VSPTVTPAMRLNAIRDATKIHFIDPWNSCYNADQPSVCRSRSRPGSMSQQNFSVSKIAFGLQIRTIGQGASGGCDHLLKRVRGRARVYLLYY